MRTPFVDLIGMTLYDIGDGGAHGRLAVEERLLNSQGIAHGGALYALADTAMGAAVYSTLQADQICATIEIKMNYFRGVAAGRQVECAARVVHRGRTTANLDAELRVGETLVARANGTFAILQRRPPGET